MLISNKCTSVFPKQQIISKPKTNPDSIVLPFLLVPVRNRNNLFEKNFNNLNTLLDQGSMKSFMLKSTAERLNLKSLGYQNLTFSTLSGVQPESLFEIVEVPLKRYGKQVVITVVLVDELPKQSYSANVVHKIMQLQRKVNSARCSISECGDVELEFLIGADYYYDVVDVGQQVGLYDKTHMIPTYYGYVMSGNVSERFEDKIPRTYSSLGNVRNIGQNELPRHT